MISKYFKKILCFLGRHRWGYFGKGYSQTRTCEICKCHECKIISYDGKVTKFTGWHRETKEDIRSRFY